MLVVKMYDDSQPRDDSGKWTDSGGGDGVDVQKMHIDVNSVYSGNINNLKKAKIAHQQLTDMGYHTHSVHLSSTSFGNSLYMNVKNDQGHEFKVRSSDHSVSNFDRIGNEIHIQQDGRLSKQDYMYLERINHPTRYTKTELESKILESVPKNKITPEHKILGERISKKTGKPIYDVERVRKDTYYKRNDDLSY